MQPQTAKMIEPSVQFSTRLQERNILLPQATELCRYIFYLR